MRLASAAVAGRGARALSAALTAARAPPRPSRGRRPAEIAAAARPAGRPALAHSGDSAACLRAQWCRAPARSGLLRWAATAGRPRGLDPVRASGGGPHARRGRDRIGQDGHPDAGSRRGDRAGHGRVVVDPKGDARHARRRRAARELAGRQFIEWTPDGRLRLQPVRHGERERDRRQGARRRALHRAALPAPGAALPRSCGARAAAPASAGEPEAIVAHMDPARLEDCSPVPAGPAGDGHPRRISLRSRPASSADLAGVRDRLAILAESDVGRGSIRDGGRRPPRSARGGPRRVRSST